jgi:ribosome-associated protein
VSDALHVAPGITVPAAALEMKAVRSSGPGGQNVNKVASKIQLRVELGRIEGLPPRARERLAALAAARLDADGRLLITSQRFRDQPRNLEDARQKLRALVARALEEPRLRRPTRASTAARERRLQAKRRDAQRKRLRRSAPDDL